MSKKRGATFKRVDPIARLLRNTTLAADQQRDIGIAYHASLQAMLNGHGTEQAWCTLSCSINNTLILAEYGHCAGAIPTIKLAQDALMRARGRAARTQKWAFDGDGARVIMAALNIHDEQLSRATRAQVTDALREVHRRVENDEVTA